MLKEHAPSQEELSRLEGTTFGSSLSPICRQGLSQIAKQVHVARGQMLFNEGDRNDNVYLLVAGRIELVMQVPGRGAVRILSLESGDPVAWSALLGNGVMTCSAQAVEDCSLLAFGSQKLTELLHTNCQVGVEFSLALATALSKRLLATRLQLLDLFGKG